MGIEPGKTMEQLGTQLQRLTLHAVAEGAGPVTGSRAYAQDRVARTKTGADAEAAIRRIVRESVIASGTAGFVTGLGGMVTLPVSLPANIAGALIINARMTGAIADLRGYDLDDPHTQAILMLIVAGSSAQGAMSELGVKLGQQAAKEAIRRIPITVIRKINQKAGMYLVAKYGTKRAAVTLAKMVPGIGGIVGGTVDASLTKAIGAAAKKAFPAS